jgi:signal transduction histidine kinase/ActR/RegA family two-component response regulator
MTEPESTSAASEAELLELRRDVARYRAEVRVQQRIWEMRGPDDIANVWQTIVDSLRELEIPFDNCDINVVEISDERPDADLNIVEQIWRSGQVAYRPDLLSEDPFGERASIETSYEGTVRAVIDVPFSHGTLALNSLEIDPFSESHMQILQAFADELSAGFQRMDDLRSLEQRNRALEEGLMSTKRHEEMQNARYRVREQVWRMRQPDDISGVLEALRDNFKALGIPYDYCSINLVRESDVPPRIIIYNLKREEPWKRHEFGFEESMSFLNLWRRGTVAHRPDVQHHDPFGERDTFKVPIRALVDVPFPQGTLAMSSLTPNVFSEEHLHVLEQMGRLLTEGFGRMDDLESLDNRNDQLEREVAERRQAELGLVAARDEAEAANRAKSTFLANMSHELRTPLNAVLGFTQLLQRDLSLAPEQRDNLNIIERNGEHLLTLINDVLEMSRIEAGRITLQEEAFDLHELLDALVDTFRLRAHDKQLQLLCERSDDVPRVLRGDHAKLRQIMVNLLSNAIKFTDKGQVLVRVRRLDERLHIEVADTGIGIGTDELSRLFEAFVQTSRASRMLGGTGLGLAISQQFALLLGGEISVSSEPGQGSRFRFDLPLVEATLDEVQTRGGARRVVGLAPGEQVPRLLVVDDRAENRLLLRRLLEPLGFDIREAVDGEDGLRVWAEFQPRLIWMDMRMPGLDGYETTRRIKASEQGRQTCVVALTASAFEEDRRRVLEAGCDDFVRKPFREDDIFTALERHLGLRFTYASEEPTGSLPMHLTRADLEDVPIALLSSLYRAANEADEDTILTLLRQIPQQADVVDGFSSLVADFRYDDIMALTKDQA